MQVRSTKKKCIGKASYYVHISEAKDMQRFAEEHGRPIQMKQRKKDWFDVEIDKDLAEDYDRYYLNTVDSMRQALIDAGRA